MEPKKITFLLLAVVCLFLVVPGKVAAFITTHYPVDVAMTNISFEAEGRIGDLSGAQTYELDIGPYTSSPSQTAQYNWPNGTPVPFILSYDKISNLVSFTVGSNTLTYTPAQMSIDIFIRTRAVYTNTSISVDNLVLNGIPVGDSLNTYIPGSSGIDILQISGASLSNGFTLTGQSTMTWAGSPPPWSKLAFQIKVAKGKADLAITKTDSPDPVNAGQNLTYTLNITNNGPCQANGVTVTDTLPAGVTFVSAASSQGICTGSGTVTCSFGSLPNGANATVTIVVTPTTVGTIKNSASVSSVDYDKQPSNNTASNVCTTVSPAPANPVADLSVSKSDSPDPVTVSDTLLYTLTVTNHGPDNATGVIVTDALPEDVILSSASPSQGTCSGTVPVTCSLGSLANNASATVLLTVIPSKAGIIIYNSASVIGNENDPNPADNTTPLIPTTVTNLPSVDADLSIAKSDSPDPVPLVGDDLTYIITVTNNGPVVATGVTVTDYLPTSVGVLQVIPLELVSVTPGQGTCNGTYTITCNMGALASGESATIEIVTKTLFAGSISNTAVVSGDQNDPDDVNNSDTENTNIGDMSRLINISSRGPVETGDNVMIGGFILGGLLPKAILIRGFGPTLADFGVHGSMANPYLELYSGSTLIASNDNWQTPVAQCLPPATECGTPQDIIDTGKSACQVAATGCTLDAAILATLPAGPYTAILRGVSGGTGVGLVGVDDPDTTTMPKLVNISSRGKVLTGDSVMIGGFIIGAGTGNKQVLIRAMGPTLADFGVSGPMANPYIELYSGSTRIATNDNWQTPISQCDPPAVSCGTPTDIQNTGKSSCTVATTGCSQDAAILVTLPPGPYTAIVRGVNGGTGVGLVGIDELGQ